MIPIYSTAVLYDALHGKNVFISKYKSNFTIIVTKSKETRHGGHLHLQIF